MDITAQAFDRIISPSAQKYIELVGKPIKKHRRSVHMQIRAKVDIPEYGVVAGTLGGYVDMSCVLYDMAWIGARTIVENAMIIDSWVAESCIITGGTIQDSQIDFACRLRESTIGNCLVGSASRITESTLTNTKVAPSCTLDNVRMDKCYASGDYAQGLYRYADLEYRVHALTIGPIGTEGQRITYHRSMFGTDHNIHIGCWKDGTLDTMMAEVDRRLDNLERTNVIAADIKALYRDEYEVAHTLITSRHKRAQAFDLIDVNF